MLAQFQAVADDFLQTNYQLPLQIPVERNNRLRTSLGRFVYQTDKKTPVKIELAGFLLDYGNHAVIIDVLKHECIHYALFVKGLPHRDGESYFEKELKKQRVSRTHTQKVGKFTIFECVKCQRMGETRNNRLLKHPEKYRTRCCQQKLRLLGEKTYDGVG